MSEFVAPLERLIEQFGKLPGVGRKTATRYALALLDLDENKACELADAIIDAKHRIKRCKVCNNISLGDLCEICEDDDREPIICVVEDARAVMSIERVRDYHGKYHVLGGVISPVHGVGPDQLKIKELLSRVCSEDIREIIIATNATVEGEATAMYITRLLAPFEVKVSRLAYGIPVGADLEYADEVTLFRAIDGRREIKQ